MLIRLTDVFLLGLTTKTILDAMAQLGIKPQMHRFETVYGHKYKNPVACISGDDYHLIMDSLGYVKVKFEKTNYYVMPRNLRPNDNLEAFVTRKRNEKREYLYEKTGGKK